jgi:hypothetical protein
MRQSKSKRRDGGENWQRHVVISRYLSVVPGASYA